MRSVEESTPVADWLGTPQNTTLVVDAKITEFPRGGSLPALVAINHKSQFGGPNSEVPIDVGPFSPRMVPRTTATTSLHPLRCTPATESVGYTPEEGK